MLFFFRLFPRQRPPPPGLTAQEAALLRKIQRRAHYLDKGFSLCGIRFGWTAIIGLIPGAGDIADASLNYFLVLRPAKKGAQLPDWLVHKMLFNNVCVCAAGSVPKRFLRTTRNGRLRLALLFY